MTAIDRKPAARAASIVLFPAITRFLQSTRTDRPAPKLSSDWASNSLPRLVPLFAFLSSRISASMDTVRTVGFMPQFPPDSKIVVTFVVTLRSDGHICVHPHTCGSRKNVFCFQRHD